MSSDMILCQKQSSKGTLRAVDAMTSKRKSWVTNLNSGLDVHWAQDGPSRREFTSAASRPVFPMSGHQELSRLYQDMSEISSYF